jgi:hypothetical protein
MSMSSDTMARSASSPAKSHANHLQSGSRVGVIMTVLRISSRGLVRCMRAKPEIGLSGANISIQSRVVAWAPPAAPVGRIGTAHSGDMTGGEWTPATNGAVRDSRSVWQSICKSRRPWITELSDGTLQQQQKEPHDDLKSCHPAKPSVPGT